MDQLTVEMADSQDLGEGSFPVLSRSILPLSYDPVTGP